MSDCKCACQTVKYYEEKRSWFCMLCFKEFIPAESRDGDGVWVFQPSDNKASVEGHGTG